MTTPDSLASGDERVDHALDDLADVDPRARRQIGLHLQPRQRQQVVDQAGHARRLVLHDLQEMVARRGVVPGRAAQRLDEARDRGERRSELMAGIGDEVGPHAVDAAGLALVLEHDDEEPGAAADRRDGHLVDPLDGDALDIVDHLEVLAPRAHALDRRLDFRGAELHHQRQAWREGAEGGTRRVVDMDRAARRVEDDQRIADGRGKALGRQPVEPAGLDSGGAVGLPLASACGGAPVRPTTEQEEGSPPP